jgi:asparaginyl-tRNA synthetase
MIRPGEYIRDILLRPVGSGVVARGWVKTRRDSKGIHFVQISDGSVFADLQVVIEQGAIPGPVLDQVTTGACIEVAGALVESPASGQAVELKAASVTVHGPADPSVYPLQKKGHTMEFLREIAHLRPRSNTFGAVFRVRNALCDAIHRFFQDRGFLYIQTPILTTSDCEGAGALFGVTTLSMDAPPRTPAGEVDFAQDFFGKPAFLAVSGQLEAEILAQAMANVYTFGPTFRAENSNTPRHLAEFWMVEPEMAFCDLDDNVALAQEFLQAIIQSVLDRCGPDIEFFNKRVDPTVLATLEHVATAPFERITYTEAIQRLEASGRSWEYPVSWGSDLQAEHERYLTEEVFGRPVVVTDYPRGIKAFYMRVNEDGRTVRAMDVLVPRIGEIIGGSQREERGDVLQARLSECGLPEAPYWWYLQLRQFGTVAHAGFGLGLERMVMYLTGVRNIRDVIPFPRTPQSADF